MFMTGFSNWMIGENLQLFWAAMQRGEFITDAAEQTFSWPRTRLGRIGRRAFVCSWQLAGSGRVGAGI
jgi:hypothetical protein